MTAQTKITDTIEFMTQTIELGFSREEVRRLTSLPKATVKYYDQCGLVVADRLGSPKKPTLRYAPSAIFRLKLLNMTKILTDKKEFIAKIFKELPDISSQGNQGTVSMINGCFYISATYAHLGCTILKISEKTKRQSFSYLYLGEVEEIASQIAEKAKMLEIENYGYRVKNSILDVPDSLGMVN